MSRRASSRGDKRKALVCTTYHGDNSSDDEITLTCEQAAWVLQSHFDCGGDDLRPTSGIPMETLSKRRRLVEMASVSSKSHTVSSRASSWRRSATGRRASGGVMRAEDLLIDIEADFFGDEVRLGSMLELEL